MDDWLSTYLKARVQELAEKGGPGSGNFGHVGRPGEVGGSGGGNSISSGKLNVDATFPSISIFNQSIRDGMIEYDNEYVVRIAGDVYEVRTEGWWPDCLESRGRGHTDSVSVDDQFEQIMVDEAGWKKADISAHLVGRRLEPEFGITYIGRLVQKDRVAEKGGPGSGNWGHAGRPGSVGGSLPQGTARSTRTGRTAAERQLMAREQGKLTGAATIRNRFQNLEAYSKGQISALEAKQKKIHDKIDIANANCTDTWKTPDYEQAEKERQELWTEDRKSHEEMWGVQEGLKDQARALLKVKDPIAIDVEAVSNFTKDRWSGYVKGIDEFRSFVTNKLGGHDDHVIVRAKRGRAQSIGTQIELDKHAGTGVVVHEMGHWLEEINYGVATRAKQFLDNRTKGESVRPLGDRYGRDEKAKFDKFRSPYCGKIYSGGHGTEIMSMGLQWFHDDPIGFAREDPEYFDFVYDTAHGNW